MNFVDDIVGIILAGGQASRMGYVDKPLLGANSRALIEHVKERAELEVEHLAISVNRHLEKYEYLDLPMITDVPAPAAGPLIGIYSAMDWYQRNPEFKDRKYLACFAADVPVFPASLVAQLADALIDSDKDVAYAISADQQQPLFSLWKMNTAPHLKKAIAEGVRGPKQIFPQLNSVAVHFASTHPADFFNVNNPADLAMLELKLESTS